MRISNEWHHGNLEVDQKALYNRWMHLRAVQSIVQIVDADIQNNLLVNIGLAVFDNE